MQLPDFARHLPEEGWQLFAPLLPPVVWCGNGRPPASTYDCLQAVFSILVRGLGGRMLPQGFPSDTTVQRRLHVWLPREAFRTAWQQRAHRYEALQGIHWDQRLLDGSKKPSQKGASTPGPVRSTVASAAPPGTSPVTPGPCRQGPSSLEPTPLRGVKPPYAYSAWGDNRPWQRGPWP
jgi:hypothetical protein